MAKLTRAATVAAILTLSLAQTIPTATITNNPSTLSPSSPSTSITSLHLGPSFASDYHMVGSVITADPTATSYLLTCPPDYDCGFPSGLHWLEGPSTLSYRNDFGADSASCILTLGTVQSARCMDVVSGDDHVSTTEAFDAGRLDTWVHPVTITGGLEKIRAVGTTGSGDGGVTRTSVVVAETSGSSSSSSTSDMTTAVSSTGTGMATAGSESSSSASTAGMAAVTGNARVVAGVAAVFGGVLVL